MRQLFILFFQGFYLLVCGVQVGFRIAVFVGALVRFPEGIRKLRVFSLKLGEALLERFQRHAVLAQLFYFSGQALILLGRPCALFSGGGHLGIALGKRVALSGGSVKFAE